jgi:sugar fermentation stimulation protein A
LANKRDQPMKLPQLVEGCFVRRDNRFRATVTIAGREAWAHVANSGRLTELFTPGRPVWLAPAAAAHRKTDYDLKLVEINANLVSVDARLPNPLFAEALSAGLLPGYLDVRQEVFLDGSRLDFRLSGVNGVCWVETKSVTLVENGTALFPDAPTSRGRRHLATLTVARDSGDQAAVVFVVQRPDAIRFAPHPAADLAFNSVLRSAAAAGVAIRAFNCHVSLQRIAIACEIPVTV